MTIPKKQPEGKFIAVFCPSSFNDYAFLYDLLIKKVENIGCILTNGVGAELPERFAREHKIPYVVCQPSKEVCVFASNDFIIQHSEHVVIIDNGASHNIDNIIEKCDKYEKKYKKIAAPEPEDCAAKLEKATSLISELVETEGAAKVVKKAKGFVTRTKKKDKNGNN